MKSPHGQPSPALLRSIHRPYPRHNAEETGGGLIAKRPENRRRLRFPSSAATKTPHWPILVRRIMLFSSGWSILQIFKAHHQRCYPSAGKKWLHEVPLRTTWKPLLAERK
jgi:hypothetical protein